jgi:hypothetical protein
VEDRGARRAKSEFVGKVDVRKEVVSLKFRWRAQLKVNLVPHTCGRGGVAQRKKRSSFNIHHVVGRMDGWNGKLGVHLRCFASRKLELELETQMFSWTWEFWFVSIKTCLPNGAHVAPLALRGYGCV